MTQRVTSFRAHLDLRQILPWEHPTRGRQPFRSGSPNPLGPTGEFMRYPSDVEVILSEKGFSRSSSQKSQLRSASAGSQGRALSRSSSAAGGSAPPSVKPLQGLPFRCGGGGSGWGHPSDGGARSMSARTERSDAPLSARHPRATRQAQAPSSGRIDNDRRNEPLAEQQAPADTAAPPPPPARVAGLPLNLRQLAEAASAKPVYQTPRQESSVRHDVEHAVTVRFFGGVEPVAVPQGCRVRRGRPELSAHSIPLAVGRSRHVPPPPNVTSGAAAISAPSHNVGSKPTSAQLLPPRRDTGVRGDMARVVHVPLAVEAYALPGRKQTLDQLSWSDGGFEHNGQTAPDDMATETTAPLSPQSNDDTDSASSPSRRAEDTERFAAAVQRYTSAVKRIVAIPSERIESAFPSGTVVPRFVEQAVYAPAAQLLGLGATSRAQSAAGALPPFLSVLIATTPASPEAFHRANVANCKQAIADAWDERTPVDAQNLQVEARIGEEERKLTPADAANSREEDDAASVRVEFAIALWGWVQAALDVCSFPPNLTVQPSTESPS